MPLDRRDRLLRLLLDEIQDEPFQARYRGREVGPVVVGWPARLQRYFWPRPDVDLRATDRWLAPMFEGAGDLSARLVEHAAWAPDERRAATRLARRMREWGRTTRGAFDEELVEAVFRRALGLRVGFDPPMSSGWTKVAALATAYLEGQPERAPHVIWDSRVSSAIVFRLDRAMAEAGGEDAGSPKTLFPRIGVVPGRGGSRRQGGDRHPSRLRLRWSYAYGRWAAQDAGTALVRDLRDGLNEGTHPPMPTAEGGTAPWTIRGVESVLFMDGY